MNTPEFEKRSMEPISEQGTNMPNCEANETAAANEFTPSEASELHIAALEFASRGSPVFPCFPISKNPLTDHGFKDASTDPDIIRSWWNKWPSVNLAIATGGRS
jgi:hypothetical protein